MARISIGQQKILDLFKPGVRLALDGKTGRYAFDDGEKLKHVDQRPIEVMLRIGLLEKDPTGRCYPSAPQPAKNCHSCRFLEWFDDANLDGHGGPDAGWGCNKHDPGSEKAESIMIQNLARDDYRNRYKRCYEAAA